MAVVTPGLRLWAPLALAGLLSWPLSIASAAAPAGAALTFAPAAPTELEGSLRPAVDVRWDGPGQLLLAVPRTGAAVVSWAGGAVGALRVEVPEGGTGIVIPGFVASSSRVLAVSSPLSEMLWRVRAPGGREGRIGEWWSEVGGVSFFEDIDVHEDELAIRGLMKADDGRSLAQDGAVAWRTRLGEGTPQLRPIAYSLAGKGAHPFLGCAEFEISPIRFLADGSLAVVLGAEPGIMVYGPDDRLRRTYDTVALGANVRCDMPDAESIGYLSDAERRFDYVSRYGYVDELIATPEGLLALVKRASAGGAGSSWRAFLLREDGSVVAGELLWRSSWPYTRVSGDVLDGRLILLFSDLAPGNLMKGARLVETRLLVSSEVPAASGVGAAPRAAPSRQ